MAAILCSSVGKMCSAIFGGVAKIVSFPCKACNAINAQLCSKDFWFYNTVVYGTSIPPIIFTIIAISQCPENVEKGRLFTWLYVNAILCFINMIASSYISYQIRKPDLTIPPSPSSSLGQQQNPQMEQNNSTLPVNNVDDSKNDIPMAEAIIIDDDTEAQVMNKEENENTRGFKPKVEKRFNQMRNNVSRFVSNISKPSPSPSAPPAPSAPPYEQSNPSPVVTPVSPQPTNPNVNHHQTSSPNSLKERTSTLCNRVTKVLCNDVWVAFYIILLCLFIVWQFLGIAWRYQDDYEHKKCYDTVEENLSNSVNCGFIFLAFSGFAFCCSLCCAVC